MEDLGLKTGEPKELELPCAQLPPLCQARARFWPDSVGAQPQQHRMKSSVSLHTANILLNDSVVILIPKDETSGRLFLSQLLSVDVC